jgi:hypothetical protein
MVLEVLEMGKIMQVEVVVLVVEPVHQDMAQAVLLADLLHLDKVLQAALQIPQVEMAAVAVALARLVQMELLNTLAVLAV